MDEVSIEKRVRGILAGVLGGGAGMEDHDDIIGTGYGLDSEMLLELLVALEDDFGVEIKDEDVVPENIGSVSGIVRYLSGVLGQTTG